MMRFLPIFASFVLLASLTHAYAADPWEGTKWKITLTSDEDGKEVTDTISFKGGSFSSAIFEKRGFKPTTYDEDTRGISVAGFTVEAKSENEGSLKWSGTKTATNLQGDLVWTKKDGTTLRYSFKGERLEHR